MINKRLTISFFCLVAAIVMGMEVYETGFSAGEHAAMERDPAWARSTELIPGNTNIAERELRDRISELEQKLADRAPTDDLAQGS